MASLLAQALAPVFRTWGARDQEGSEDQGTTKAEGTRRASPKDLPEIDYPTPLVVKNTFIDTDPSLSIDGFLQERGFRSLPANAMETAFHSQEPVEPVEPVTPAKPRLGRLPDPDSSSSCRSTSVGSFSVRNAIDEVSPSTLTEGPLDTTPQRVHQGSSSHSPAGLPDFQYPAPLQVKNTFLCTDIGRPLSLDGFFEERLLHSCPVSGIMEIHDGEGEEEDALEEVASRLRGLNSAGQTSPAVETASEEQAVLEPAATPASQSHGGEDSPAAVRDPGDSMPQSDTMAACPPAGITADPAAGWVQDAGIPPPPAVSPTLPAALAAPAVAPWLDTNFVPAPMPMPMPPAAPWMQATAVPPMWPAAFPAPQGGTVLNLSEALDATALGTPMLPTVGSADHHLGTCKPCAHAHSAKGCKNGVNCAFCHICPPGELKRQQKHKRWLQRQEAANA